MASVMLTPPLIRGDGEEIPFAVTDPDGSPRDISGDTFRFSAKKNPNKQEVFVTKTTEDDGIEFTSAVNGEAKVIIQPEDFENLTADTTFSCDIEGRASDGTPYTHLFKIKVVLDIST